MEKDNASEMSVKNTDRLSNEASKDISRTFKDLDVFKKPMQLVDTGKDGTLFTVSNTIESISKIDATLQVVAIAGPYRTGKSYLINKLAGTTGFVVGDSTEAVTKGIWVWCREHPSFSDEKPTVLVLLDTEGLCDIKKGNKHHDQKIMTLVTLLCNVLVYNMIGRFDDDSMSKLSTMSSITEEHTCSNCGKTYEIQKKFDNAFMRELQTELMRSRVTAR